VFDEICALERTARAELTDDAWRLLVSHPWPGNVRELKTLLHRAVALHRDVTPLTAEMIVASAPAGSTLRGKGGRVMAAADLSQRMASTEREEILRALEKAGGIRRRAAEILGISYRGLGKKMVRLGIERKRRGE
jgi:two-component system response regulator PilR (NtrC family)